MMLHKDYNMILTSYPAGKGDAFLLGWGEKAAAHHLLIDSGMPGTYRFIKASLENLEKLDVVILTHVDYDHLGGFFKFMADKTPKWPEDFPIYMNTPSLVLTPPDDDKVGLEHGIELEEKLKALGISCRPLYNGLTTDNILELEGLKVQVLTPPKRVIDQLLNQWTADDLYLEYQQASKASDKVSKSTGALKAYDDIIASSESVHKWEDDLINSSSIAFIASYAGCSILFLGDANPDLIVEELTRLGYSADNKLKVDLVKLSHHGCKHNSSKALFSAIDCDSYLISTNGAGPYYHPDRETIVRLSEYGRPTKQQTLYIYFNHDLDLLNFITKKESVDWNLKLAYQTTFNFYDCKCFQKK